MQRLPTLGGYPQGAYPTRAVQHGPIVAAMSAISRNRFLRASEACSSHHQAIRHTGERHECEHCRDRKHHAETAALSPMVTLVQVTIHLWSLLLCLSALYRQDSNLYFRQSQRFQ